MLAGFLFNAVIVYRVSPTATVLMIVALLAFISIDNNSNDF